ncbi:MAG TPA: N,N-dimethylformamidase beta subunit family domain-containing protein [Mycobacterium sp.]|nr:N,N-dimethylformamidase beta subunit family domain-containing protein [Mycobacterium sp.]
MTRRSVLRLVAVAPLAPMVACGRAEQRPAQNQTSAENALPGTADWTLTNPATDREIEGYASATSVDAGESIALHVSTAAASFQFEVFRMGWYQGLGARRVAGPVTVAGGLRSVPAPDPTTGLVDCDWPESYRLSTEKTWATGVYLVRLTASDSGKQSYAVFVVRDDMRAHDVLFQLPVTTYQAYNFWGGKSLYPWGSGPATPWASATGPPAVKVSFNRPYAASTSPSAASGIGAGDFLTNVQPVASGYPISPAGWDYNMIRWLEREGYDVAYATSIDTHTSPAAVRSSKVFMSHGHDEYWTWQMRDNVEAARDAKVNLAFLSANTSCWQIRLEPSPATGAANRVIVCYKDAATDPYSHDGDPSHRHLVTTQFRQSPVSRPEEQMKGSQYIVDPVDGDMVVADASHWVFKDTGLIDGDRLKGLLGYEVDGRFGGEPSNTVTLASTPVGNPPTGQPGQYSQMTYYTAASSAGVFSTGTIQWCWGLDDYNAPAIRTSRLSTAAAAITRNVLTNFGVTPGGPQRL